MLNQLEARCAYRMIQDQALHTVGRALRNGEVVDFVGASVKAGYRECFLAKGEPACAMVEDAFTRLAKSQQEGVDPARLAQVTSALLQHTFRKQERSFWFNRIYHEYKTLVKPETDFRQMQKLLPGEKVLDYGCGSGYLAARLAKGGYKVFTTDVLDYRYEEARRLPFVQMASATDIPYPDDSMDVAIVQAVLHHIDPGNLPIVLRRLRAISRHVLIKEDTYGLPSHLEGVAETQEKQSLLRTFVSMPLDAQQQALALIDFFANAIAQGLPEMNMPFEFKTVTEWEEVLRREGFKVNRTVLAGFEPGRMHKSCHVWLLCERAS
ncbi:MAG TPA: class I SAM-dependent methyltransferase [Terriglobales bacterium]|jgi:SAM-dependent methyltransferase|nr:class I SAM-dependent methyltransferase [Terriglobales bacterium]